MPFEQFQELKWPGYRPGRARRPSPLNQALKISIPELACPLMAAIAAPAGVPMAWPFPPPARRPTAGCLWIVGGSIYDQPYAGWNGPMLTTAMVYGTNPGAGRQNYIFAPYDSVLKQPVGVGTSYPTRFGNGWEMVLSGETVQSGYIYLAGNGYMVEREGSQPRSWYLLGSFFNPSAGTSWATGPNWSTDEPTGNWPSGGSLGIQPMDRLGLDGQIANASNAQVYTTWSFTVQWRRYGPDGTDFLPPSLAKNYPIRVPWSYY